MLMPHTPPRQKILGYSTTSSTVEFTPDYTGIVLRVFSGAMKVILMSAKDFIDSIGEPASRNSMLTLSQKAASTFRSLSTEKALKLATEKRYFFHGQLAAGDSLVVPAGYVVGQVVTGTDNVAAVRSAYIIESDDAIANLRALEHVVPKD